MTNVVIVGADRGIGAAMANVYHRRGDVVTAVCLAGGTELDSELDSELDEDIRVVPDIDVTNDDAVQRLATALTEHPIDVLVHVAGRGSFDRWGQFDYAHYLKEHNRARIIAQLERLATRASVSSDEVRMLRGVCRQIRWLANRTQR